MPDNPSLSVCGEVERPACLELVELRSLMDAELVADFHCREGWSRLGERWRGVRLTTLLALAGAADAAGFVTVASGEYTAARLLRSQKGLVISPPDRARRVTAVGHGRASRTRREHVDRHSTERKATPRLQQQR